jgi:hypothetical protein
VFDVFEVIHPYFGYGVDPALINHPTDEFGFVNEISPLSPPAPGVLRVGVLGGSVALCLAVFHRRHLRDGIAASLGRPPETVEVITLAQGGYKQPQQIIVLNFFLVLGAKLHLVINLDGFNEIALHPAENATKGVDLTYPRSWYFRIEKFSSAEERLFAARLESLKEQAARLALQLESRSSFVSTGWLRLRQKMIAREIRGLEEKFRQATFPDLTFQTRGRGRSYATDAEMFEQLVSVWSNASKQIDLLCRAQGVAYHHFIQPNQYYPGSKTLSTEEKAYFYDPNHPYRFGAENGYPYLLRDAKSLREAGVNVVDLSTMFRDTPETTYMDTCCHLNDVGNKLLSKRIADALAS